MSDKVYLERLGAKVLKLRQAKGLSQEQLASKLKTQHPQVRRVEQGKVNSTINMLRKIAKHLGVKVSELVNV